MKKHYQAIIIGAGQSGVPLASALAKAGWTTALIERKHIGGTCVNVGCTPSKTMIASARVAHMARRVADYGVGAGEVTVDMSAVVARKQQVVESFRSGSRKRLEEQDGLELIFGEASFTGRRELEVKLSSGERRALEADYTFIDVGQHPVIPPIDGLADVPYLTSTTAMELTELPDHLLVLGGGYIGLELAQMFRRFGSEVTIIQRGKQLLGHEDPDIAEEVAKILNEDGIEVWLEHEASSVSQRGDDIYVVARHQSGEKEARGSHLLVATGRTSNTASLNLQKTGLKTDEQGNIKVNERLQTNVPGIFALGDVKGGPAFTHISYDDYRIIKSNLLHGGQRTTTDRPLPYTVFIDPQLGRIGLTEQQAEAQGYHIKVAKLPMSSVARAIETSETRGVMKAIVNADNDQILGAAILGLEGGEIASLLQVAMMGNLPYTALRDGVFSHPTLAESMNNLFMTVD